MFIRLCVSLLHTKDNKQCLKNKPPRKWLNRPLVDVSSMTILACIFYSTWPTIGSTHPFWHAGVLPVPEGAVAIRCRLAFSSYEPKSLSVFCPSKELVETRAEQSNISFVVPLLQANAVSHWPRRWGTTSSIGRRICPSLASNSAVDVTLLCVSMIERKNRRQNKTSFVDGGKRWRE